MRHWVLWLRLCLFYAYFNVLLICLQYIWMNEWSSVNFKGFICSSAVAEKSRDQRRFQFRFRAVASPDIGLAPQSKSYVKIINRHRRRHHHRLHSLMPVIGRKALQLSLSLQSTQCLTHPARFVSLRMTWLARWAEFDSGRPNMDAQYSPTRLQRFKLCVHLTAGDTGLKHGSWMHTLRCAISDRLRTGGGGVESVPTFTNMWGCSIPILDALAIIFSPSFSAAYRCPSVISFRKCLHCDAL